MSDSHSTTPAPADKTAKPDKPYPEFPLLPHATKHWAKKIRGKLHYFGPWDNPKAALDKYLKDKDALHAGNKPRPDQANLTVKKIANKFLAHKQAHLGGGELSPHTFANYRRAARELVAAMQGRLVVDVDPEDFVKLRNRMAKKWGPHHLAVTVQHIRSIFEYAFDAADPGAGALRAGLRAAHQEEHTPAPRQEAQEAVHRLAAAGNAPQGWVAGPRHAAAWCQLWIRQHRLQ